RTASPKTNSEPDRSNFDATSAFRTVGMAFDGGTRIHATPYDRSARGATRVAKHVTNRWITCCPPASGGDMHAGKSCRRTKRRALLAGLPDHCDLIGSVQIRIDQRTALSWFAFLF